MRVPDGWKLVHLKDVASKIQDGNYGADYPKSDEFLVGGIPFLTSKVIGGNGTINRNKMDFISPEKHLVLKKAQITKRDILFTNRGANVGTIAIVDDDILDANIGPQLTLIRTNPIKANYKFLFQSLRGPFFQKQVGQQDSGSAMNFFGIKETEKFKLMLPPIAEQQKIAKILSTWDKAIEKLEALIAAKQKRKKALMQQLLTGKKRFAGFEGEWKEVRLGDVGIISSAGVDKKIVHGEHEVRLLNFLDVFRRSFIFNSEISHRVTAPIAKINKCDVKKGDIFFTPSSETRDELAISAVAMEDMPGVVYSYHIVRFRLNENWDLKFRAYVFQSDDFYRQAYFLGDGSGQRYVISQDNFRGMSVKIPSHPEQRKIGSFLFAADQEIQTHQKQLSALKEQKKGLMQQLLTGKKRVKLDEPELLAAAGA